MPVVFRYEGYRFFFYSNEGDPREPIHIHVRSADAEAKFWLRPDVVLAYNEGLNGRTFSLLARVTEENRTLFEQAWHDHFG